LGTYRPTIGTYGPTIGAYRSRIRAYRRFEADRAAKGHGLLVDIGVGRVALRIFDIRFLRAAEWHFMTEERLADADAAQYAGYRHLVRRTSG
jgi:hypothetical protein